MPRTSKRTLVKEIKKALRSVEEDDPITIRQLATIMEENRSIEGISRKVKISSLKNILDEEFEPMDQIYRSGDLLLVNKLDRPKYKDMPLVRTTEGYLIPWDKNKIIEQLQRETALAKTVFGLEPISSIYAEKIADEVERRIRLLKLKYVSGPMLREITNNILLEWSEEVPEFAIYRNLLSRVGSSLYDAYQIDMGIGDNTNDNFNQQLTPFTSYKKKADRLSKEEYLLLMPPKLATSHHQGDININALEYFGSAPFCHIWDLRYFLYYGLLPDGLGFLSTVAGPAKMPEVAILHSIKVLSAAQTTFGGGQGFLNYTLFLAPYMRGLPYARIKQLAQMMLYELNQTYVSHEGQLVLSNIQLPMGVPRIWQNVPVVMRGKVGPDVYGNYENEVQTFSRAITEVALDGDYWGKPFSFPKLDFYVSPEFLHSDYDDLWLLVHLLAVKFNVPYFDNMQPFYRSDSNQDRISGSVRCAYQFSTSEIDDAFNKQLNFVNGQHFSMGCWQVVSVNMSRLAYKANGDYDRLLLAAKENMKLAIEVFKIKKMWMERLIANNIISFATQRPRDPRTGKKGPPAVDLDNLIFIIGIVGINEMVQFFTGKQLHESPEAVRLALNLLSEMKSYCREIEMVTGMRIKLARTHAKNTAQIFAIKDLASPEYNKLAKTVFKGEFEQIPVMSTNSKNSPHYYSSGTQTHDSASLQLDRKIDIEQQFFPLTEGGNVFHVLLGEDTNDPLDLFKLTQEISKKSQIGYFTYKKDFDL